MTHPRRGSGREGEGRPPGRARRRRAAPLPVAHPPGLDRRPPGLGPAVVTGTGDLAPGAGRRAARSTAPLAAVGLPRRRCADQWFTGVGAGATPQLGDRAGQPQRRPGGRATSVRWSQAGALDVPALRGVSVPGGSSTRARPRPRSSRAAASCRPEVHHQPRAARGGRRRTPYDELGIRCWRPRTGCRRRRRPPPRNLLLGLARGAGERTLVLGEPRRRRGAGHRPVVTPTSVFAPAGVEPVRVAPGTTEPVTLDDAARRGRQGGRDRAAAWSRPVRSPPPSDSSSATTSPWSPRPRRWGRRDRRGGRPRARPKRLLLADPAGVGLRHGGRPHAAGKQLSTADGRAGTRHRARRHAARRHGAGAGHPRAHLGPGGAARDGGEGVAVVPLRELVLTGPGARRPARAALSRGRAQDSRTSPRMTLLPLTAFQQQAHVVAAPRPCRAPCGTSRRR